ncbi:hypothetical protein BU24DRAFT_428663 [Aaosphaeria arxii CBS 175.79]|uniref:Uncharacterized protein n=1 Tax=Aaosphaeria arxii CBS 175.79 TaxID=1450172 RepID=A0A6A5X8B4_9PLEO|nr:uncharacterized protein BU24DRAFT_428663 [Aaosphaeria arxii CBS 175.79]KAF2009140.1 hypothetical protein BU24DRAFT_428663 [Aaosphaeria arxii CBS 175.79]
MHFLSSKYVIFALQVGLFPQSVYPTPLDSDAMVIELRFKTNPDPLSSPANGFPLISAKDVVMPKAPDDALQGAPLNSTTMMLIEHLLDLHYLREKGDACVALPPKKEQGECADEVIIEILQQKVRMSIQDQFGGRTVIASVAMYVARLAIR